MTPALSIVMPCYNRAAILGQVLCAYERQEGQAPFEIIAIDDGSDDATPALLRAYQPRRYRLRVLELTRNAGPANARNQGLALAQAPLVMLVGDDILPAGDFVAQHLAAHQEHAADVWAVLGKTVWPDELPQNTLMRHIDGLGAQQFSYFYMRHGQEMDFRHFYTSNISLKRALLRQVRPWFDTGFRYAAYEDIELGYRLERQCGLRITYTERALGYHHHYYTLWNFVERQYRCGLMSAVFVHKHPHLRRRWQFGRLRAYALLARLPDARRLLDGPAGAQLLEIEQLALHLASYYEQIEVQPLDRLYLVLLSYFLRKGMIDGDLPPALAEDARRMLLLVSLGSNLREIIETLQARRLPCPNDVCLSLLALLRRYDLPSVRCVWMIWNSPYMRRVLRA